MRKVDFSLYEESVPSVDEFGLVDPDDKNGKGKVFISLDKANDKWGATVKYSSQRFDYRFIPVDNNIELKRDDGSDAPRCDAILTTRRTVCFIELKNQRKDFIPKAKKQILSTIDFFDRLEEYKTKLAYICNRKKEIANVSTKTGMNAFLKETGIPLKISSNICELD